jgi:phosphohistidine phosphatase SixA
VRALSGVLFSLSVMAMAPTATTAQSGPSMVILVRHAEKAAVSGDDPPISELGHERALALAAALTSSPPSAIIVSSRKRTVETAADVAKATGVAPQVISLDGGGAAHIAAVAAAVRQTRGVVLVVGHSNTIPAVIKALGGPTLPDICDATYSHLFVLTPAHDGQPAALVMSRFGANEGPPPASCAGMIPK